MMQHPRLSLLRRRRHRGFALLYALIAMTAFGAICLLSVDLGRAHLVKTELRRAADAVARYSAGGVPTGTSFTRATWLAAQHTADGTPLSLPAADVEPGTWDAGALAFTPGGAAPNAVR